MGLAAGVEGRRGRKRSEEKEKQRAKSWLWERLRYNLTHCPVLTNPAELCKQTDINRRSESGCSSG